MPSQRPTRPTPACGPDRRHRLAPALGVLFLVLGGHALLLGDLPASQAPARTPQPTPPPAAVLQTRQIMALAEATPVPRPPPTPARQPEAVAMPPLAKPAAQVATRLAEPAIHPLAAEPLLLLRTAATQGADAPAAAAPDGHASEGAEGITVPVYATRLPPAARLQYELRRGALRGSGQLVWLPAEDAYELSLEGGAFGAVLISQSSRGAYDAAGIAPVRFLDRRRGRDAQAANFQRDRALITFSGPDVQAPLLPGTQDRLSWMLQISAIIEADPKRFVPGTRITLHVVGARGDASVSNFDIESRESIELPAGPVAGALRLKREPRKLYDTQAEVWLDPARHHLPVKVRQAASQGGEATEFLLRSFGPP